MSFDQIPELVQKHFPSYLNKVSYFHRYFTALRFTGIVHFVGHIYKLAIKTLSHSNSITYLLGVKFLLSDLTINRIFFVQIYCFWYFRHTHLLLHLLRRARSFCRTSKCHDDFAQLQLTPVRSKDFFKFPNNNLFEDKAIVVDSDLTLRCQIWQHVFSNTYCYGLRDSTAWEYRSRSY